MMGSDMPAISEYLLFLFSSCMTCLAATTFTVEILSTRHAWVRKDAVSLAYKQINWDRGFLFIEVSSSSQVRASTDYGKPEC